MRALVIERQGDPVAPNVTCRDDFPDYDPSALPPGAALVRTLASALNHLDLWVGRGVPGLTLDYPRVGGCDACGEVEAVGEGVDRAWIGRRVILNAAVEEVPSPRPSDGPGPIAAAYELIGEHTTPGTHAERFVAPVTQLAEVPPSADPREAAAFGLTFLTAYSMLVGKANLRPGQRVLITGIGGGVALAALALCRHVGCPVCVTSRHRWKLERAARLGAEEAVLDEGADWSRMVRAWTGKRGVDVVVDSVGAATHLNCIKSMARGGVLVTPGCTSGPAATTDLARIFWNQLRIAGSTMGTGREFAEVVALFGRGDVRPVIDSVHTPADGQLGYQRLESGEQFGKVVIDWATRGTDIPRAGAGRA